MKVLVLFAALVLCACYSPSLRDCTVACASPADCGGGQVCTDGWCAGPEASCTGAMMPDGHAVTIDARMPSQCGPGGCPGGACVDGVCIYDCSGTNECAMDIMCPPNVPCRVICGSYSCDKKVLCGMASSCEVQCNGIDACAEEIDCGMKPCDVTCAGPGSCKKKVKCKESCRCDVECTGLASCAEPAECPLMMNTCRQGNGCSSELAGCDRCEQ